MQSNPERLVAPPLPTLPFATTPLPPKRVEIPGVSVEDGAVASDLMEAGREARAEQVRYAIKRLTSLATMGKSVYRNTVHPAEKARRRGKAGEVRRARAKATRLATVAARSQTARAAR